MEEHPAKAAAKKSAADERAWEKAADGGEASSRKRAPVCQQAPEPAASARRIGNTWRRN